LEQANSLEAKLLSVESIKEFTVGQKHENNVKKTTYDINVSFKFQELLGEID